MGSATGASIRGGLEDRWLTKKKKFVFDNRGPVAEGKRTQGRGVVGEKRRLSEGTVPRVDNHYKECRTNEKMPAGP